MGGVSGNETATASDGDREIPDERIASTKKSGRVVWPLGIGMLLSVGHSGFWNPRAKDFLAKLVLLRSQPTNARQRDWSRVFYSCDVAPRYSLLPFCGAAKAKTTTPWVGAFEASPVPSWVYTPLQPSGRGDKPWPCPLSIRSRPRCRRYLRRAQPAGSRESRQVGLLSAQQPSRNVVEPSLVAKTRRVSCISSQTGSHSGGIGW